MSIIGDALHERWAEGYRSGHADGLVDGAAEDIDGAYNYGYQGGYAHGWTAGLAIAAALVVASGGDAITVTERHRVYADRCRLEDTEIRPGVFRYFLVPEDTAP